MYNIYYSFSGKPFQLNPDPDFFYGSKGHNRAMAYLQYGLSQEEGFIVITGEVGAGKTTLVRSLCRGLDAGDIVVGHIVNTALEADDVLRMVTAAFNLPFDRISKAALLLCIEQYMKECSQRGQRLLLIVDEAQNLSRSAVEELRMLSNMHVGERPLLQIFLLGQPEFRATLMREDMLQLRQRVTATYHLGSLDAAETRAYIEHRLRAVGWCGDPRITESAYAAIHAQTGGIPRRINTLCDRLFLMGYLEELHVFDLPQVEAVIADIEGEFSFAGAPDAAAADREDCAGPAASEPATEDAAVAPALAQIEDRMSRMESSVSSLLDALRKLIPRRA